MRKTAMVLLSVIIIISAALSAVISVKASNEDLVEIKDAVRSMDIAFGGGNLYVELWDEEYVGLKIEKGEKSNGFEYKFEVKNEVLYIEGSQKNGNTFAKGDNKVCLYIPSDKYLEDFTLISGDADTLVKNIYCKNLRIDAAVGKVDIIEFNTVNADITLGMGIINAKGKIAGNADAFCVAGILNIKFSDAEKEHDYLINTTFGKIKIGDTVYGVMSNEKNINDSDSKINLECVAGQIELEFEND